MRTITPSMLSELQSKELRPFYLLRLYINETYYRYTDCDIPLVVRGNTYVPRGFKIGNVQYSIKNIVDSLSVSVDDIDQALVPLFTGGTPRGETVVYELVLIDDSYDFVNQLSWYSGVTWVSPIHWSGLSGSVTLFEGIIDEWSADETDLEIVVTSLANQWSQRTLAKQSASCRWKRFEGDECSYSNGAGWCDRTYSRCDAIGNTANFGGFRWLPSLIGKDIWWGKQRGANE